MPLVVNGMKITNKKARQNEFVGLKYFRLLKLAWNLRERLFASLFSLLALAYFSCAAGV